MEAQKVEVPYKEMVLSDGSPNESWLAGLRSSLKAMEEKGGEAMLFPLFTERECKDVDAALEITAAYKHCARRVKDCASVKGFFVPPVFRDMDRGAELVENFKTELLEKHPHYVFAD